MFAHALSGLEISTDPEVCGRYAHDAAPFSPAGRPTVVVFPRSVEQVQQALRAAAQLQMPIVPQGARTGLTGAANAVDGCIVLSLNKMDKILTIDIADRLVRVQPGVTIGKLGAAVAPHGLRYPDDSEDRRTVGGIVAGGAQGIRELSVVLPDGRLTRLDTRLAGLFVGSEGTLGVVVEAVLELAPAQTDSLALLAQFAAADTAGEAIEAILRSGHRPSAISLLDSSATAAVAQTGHPDLIGGSAVTLVVECDSPDRKRAVAELGMLCEEAGAARVVMAGDEATAARLRDVTRLVGPALSGRGRLGDELTVLRSRIPELCAEIAEIAARNEVVIATIFRVSEGRAHPTVLFDQSDLDSEKHALVAHDEVLDAACRLGGAAHGIGLLKKDWLLRELDPVALQLHRDIKRMLDPGNLLNPGKVF